MIAPTRKPLVLNGKLVNPLGSRLEELAPILIAHKPDAVICALGTTMAKAGSKVAFRYVDYELPIAFGKAGHIAGLETYEIVTAMGASPESMSFYYRTKGEVEREIGKIGFRSLTICRPSLINGERNEARLAEGAMLTLVRLFAPILPKKFPINPADAIASALLNAVIVEKPGTHRINAAEMH